MATPRPIPRSTRRFNLHRRPVTAAVVVSLGLAAALLSGCTNDTRDDAPDTTVSKTVDTTPLAADNSLAEGSTGSEDSAPAALDTSAAADGSLLSVLTEDGRYSTFVSAIESSGVAEKLSQKGPFTVFAPTDQAFQKLPTEVVAKLLLPENSSTLEKVLKYHVLGGLVATGTINEGDKDSLEGKKLHFTFVDGEITVNGAPFVSELTASNGIVHGLDFVLVPPEVDLGSLGGTIVTTATTEAPVVGVPILQSLEDQGTFTTLLSAIEKAGLKEQLSGEGPFTVFAPTDDAFNRLPGGVTDKLLLPQNKAALVTFLTHHVIADRVNGRDLKDKQDLKMLDGTTVKVGIDQGKITLDDATMTFADQESSNGVVHIINAALRPGSLDLTTLPG